MAVDPTSLLVGSLALVIPIYLALALIYHRLGYVKAKTEMNSRRIKGLEGGEKDGINP